MMCSQCFFPLHIYYLRNKILSCGCELSWKMDLPLQIFLKYTICHIYIFYNVAYIHYMNPLHIYVHKIIRVRCTQCNCSLCCWLYVRVKGTWASSCCNYISHTSVDRMMSALCYHTQCCPLCDIRLLVMGKKPRSKMKTEWAGLPPYLLTPLLQNVQIHLWAKWPSVHICHAGLLMTPTHS